MIKYFFTNFTKILKGLNQTPLKRIVIYFSLIYPLYFIYINKDGLSMLLNDNQKTVTISNVSESQERCYMLRTKYNAESVIIYAYQPRGNDKTYKERLIFSSNIFRPYEKNRIVNLFSRSQIVESLKKNGYAIITPKSKNHESSILLNNNLSLAIITPIRENNLLLGEVIWLFKDKKLEEIDVQTLVTEGEVFLYDFDR